MKQNRMESALDRLNHQLERGVKNTKEGTKDLTDKDIIRINKEISVLKSRI